LNDIRTVSNERLVLEIMDRCGIQKMEDGSIESVICIGMDHSVRVTMTKDTLDKVNLEKLKL